MPKTTKDKAPKQKSNEALKKHEPIIQDRIAGLTIAELVRKHGFSRDAIRKILDANAERIKTERDVWLAERQEKINKALDDDVQEVAQLLTESTIFLRRLIERINTRLADETPLKEKDLAAFADVAVKAMDRVHTVVLNQQKEASRE